MIFSVISRCFRPSGLNSMVPYPRASALIRGEKLFYFRK